MSLCIILHQLLATLLPYTTLFRSGLLDPRRADRLLLGGLPRRLVLRLLRLLLAATLMLLPRVVLVLSGLERSEEHTSELQSRGHLVCRLLLEKNKMKLRNR